jgi:hypothetical protein
MPRYQKTGITPVDSQSALADRLRHGKVVPVISNVISNDLGLGGHARLAAAYAQLISYPLSHQDDLSQMLQLKSITDKALAKPWDLGAHYLNFAKNQLYDLAQAAGAAEDTLAEIETNFDDLSPAQFCQRLGYPSFNEGADNPFLLLADLPLPIYLTTSYHGFIEEALRRASKKPRSDICRWHNTLESIPSVLTKNYEPSIKEPLVYHLHGFDEYPDSLVLTEDNYLEFLVAISEHRGKAGDRIALRVRQAMAESALILLGYSLRSWDFSTLFWGLIKTRPASQPGVFIQLRPNGQEERYLEQYLSRAEFEVYRGDVQSYLKQLVQQV